MELKIKITTSTKEIINNYDADDLLRTIPYDYRLNQATLNLYKAKPAITSSITLTEQIYNWLNAMAKNNNIPFSLLFNFLIETIADCGKTHTKKIKQALDCYYYAVAHDKSLFSQILSGYALSGFYNENVGLSEEGVAYFLATSSERTSYRTII